MSKHKQQLVLIFIIGLLAGFAIAKIGMKEGEDVAIYDESRSKVVTQEVLTTKDSTESLSASRMFVLPKMVPMNTRVNLSVLDQPATTTVQIAHVVVNKPTWLAIYEEINNTPGSILGAQKIVSTDKSFLENNAKQKIIISGSYNKYSIETKKIILIKIE